MTDEEKMIAKQIEAYFTEVPPNFYWGLNRETGETYEIRDRIEAAKEFEDRNRLLKQEDVGPYWISTVFLVHNHAFGGGYPILFETLINENGKECFMMRYSDMHVALDTHEKIKDHVIRYLEEKRTEPLGDYLEPRL